MNTWCFLILRKKERREQGLTAKGLVVLGGGAGEEGGEMRIKGHNNPQSQYKLVPGRQYSMENTVS